MKHIYFVVKTKGSMDTLEFNHISPLEQAKIGCAKKHFATLSDRDIVYNMVNSYQKLWEIVRQ